jgi:translation initiation factor SUI1
MKIHSAFVVKRGIAPYDGVMMVLNDFPICARVGDQIGICRKNQSNEWWFVGGGVIRAVKAIKVAPAASKHADAATVSSADDSGSILEIAQNTVHIRYQQRNQRKGITIVSGISSDLDLKKIVSKMTKLWGVGGSIKHDPTYGDVIVIQGDLRQGIHRFLVSLNITSRDHIVVHGF